jgi:hypothetical protein
MATLVNGEGRFIPACAGNASGSKARSKSTSVHPRVCGERFVTQNEMAPVTGSSPRVRGTLDPPAVDAVNRRFIPAVAATP